MVLLFLFYRDHINDSIIRYTNMNFDTIQQFEDVFSKNSNNLQS